MTITIEKVCNGWIVRTSENVAVFEVEENFQHPELFERLKFVQVLNHINDLVGPQQNAFGEHEITVDLKPGDEWVGIQDFYGDQDVKTSVQKISKEIRKSTDKANILGVVPKRKRGRPRKS